MLCAAVPVAALLITSAGGYLSYRLYKNGKNCLHQLFFFSVQAALFRFYYIAITCFSSAY